MIEIKIDLSVIAIIIRSIINNNIRSISYKR